MECFSVLGFTLFALNFGQVDKAEQIQVDNTPMNDEFANLEALESNQMTNPDEGLDAMRYSA